MKGVHSIPYFYFPDENYKNLDFFHQFLIGSNWSKKGL
jgi:hypothetical protein